MRLFKALPSQQRLKFLFDYDDELGCLRWKNPKARNVNVGDIAGCVDKNGYTRVEVDGELHLLHRLIFQFHKGNLDTNTQIDHINKIKDSILKDNRIENLRPATHSQNLRNTGVYSNNKLGIKGVRWHDDRKKYQAQITINNKFHHLGYFSNKFDAYEAYKNKCQEIDSEFYSDEDNMRPEVFLEYQDYLLQKDIIDAAVSHNRQAAINDQCFNIFDLAA